MSNFLSIEEAIELSEIEADDFRENYIESGKISVQVNNGLKQIELSEFYRVFPQKQIQRKHNKNLELELELKELKIENLEYQVVNLQRQLDKQSEEYNWLRGKFDNTTLLLEQKLDTSEVDKYKQEIRLLSHQAIQWEKKYNTLLAANELKTLVRENRELKEQLQVQIKPSPSELTPTIPNQMSAEQIKLSAEVLHLEELKAEILRLQQLTVSGTINSKDNLAASEELQTSKASKTPRHKIFGLF
ncbi:MAG: hypothetical protein K2Y14_10315 [Burkholderiales bacterium]|nr:hypothetical protein [Burkholderiales bacterium]